MRRGRRGFSLIEFAAASAVLATAMTLGAQVLGAGAATRQTARLRELALLEVGNLAQRVRAAGVTVTREQTAAWISGSNLPAVIPGAELSIELRELPGPVAAKAALIRCRWRDRRGVEQPAVQAAVIVSGAPR